MWGLEEEEAQPQLRTRFPYEFSFPKRHQVCAFRLIWQRTSVTAGIRMLSAFSRLHKLFPAKDRTRVPLGLST